MRIWHESLIPHLCRQHLLAMWRESLGAYSIITNNKKGYSKHPAVREFRQAPKELHRVLAITKAEMTKRGYTSKQLPEIQGLYTRQIRKPWQTIEQQKQILRDKQCDCTV